MSINGTALFEAKAKEYVRGTQDSQFIDAYLRALNFALPIVCGLTDQTEVGPYTDTSQTIALSSYYEEALSRGIDRQLCKVGMRRGDMALDELELLFQLALRDARTIRDIKAVAAATDGETFADMSES